MAYRSRSKPAGRAATSANDWTTRKAREAARSAHNGLCDLCGAAAGERGLCGMTRRRGLDWDHDHGSGAHRGFICARANRQLWAWVTPEWLRATADYLVRAPVGYSAVTGSAATSNHDQVKADTAEMPAAASRAGALR